MPLTVSGISKRFKQNWALRDVSFEVADGTIFGIFGPADSGKSVMLRILAGEGGKYSGSFSYGNSQGASKRAGARAVLVTGQPAPPDLLGLFGLKPENSRSLGRIRRERISDAVRSDARVVLLDDALCGIDAGAKASLFEELAEQAKSSGKIIVLAASDFTDILECCEETAVFRGGEVLQTGTPQQVYLEPETAEVARLTGRNNIFEARRLTSSKSDTPEFQTIEGSHKLTVRKISKARLGPLNQNMLLSIRPEHISISFGASFPEDNLIKARIAGVRFLGPNTLVDLYADGLRLSALVMRLVGLKPSDECMLGLPPDRIAVYDR